MVNHTRHITFTKKRNPRKVVLLLCAWFIVAASVFAWFSWQNGVFKESAKAYADTIRATMDAANAQVKVAKAANDSTKTAEILSTLASGLEQKQVSAPKAPALLGLQLGADAERAKQTRLDAATKKSVADLRTVAAYITYSQKASVDLQLLSLKSAANYDQLVALADAWKQTADTLAAAAPPKQLTEVNATLVQKAHDVQNIVSSLAELYKKTDEAGFAAKKAELVAAIEAFKPIGGQIAQIAAGFDGQLANDLAELRKNL